MVAMANPCPLCYKARGNERGALLPLCSSLPRVVYEKLILEFRSLAFPVCRESRLVPLVMGRKMGKETCLVCVLYVQCAQGCPVHPASEVVFALSPRERS